jgi:predicted LPLAT superfamily acyltransferase
MTELSKFTEMQEAFMEALLGEARGDIRRAMALAGYSENTKVKEVVGPLKEEILDRTNMMMAMNAPKAAFGMVNVLDDPTALGARNQINAAKEVLDRVGLVKKEQVQVTATGGGMFILPPKNDDELAE